MKLEKAIEIVSMGICIEHCPSQPDWEAALKLLTEAGKQIKLDRQNSLPYPSALLPGETEE